MLEAKTLTIKKSTNKSGKVVNFIPEIIEDKEVYSVVNKNNEHCGYITEDLFNFLMEQGLSSELMQKRRLIWNIVTLILED